MKDSRHAVAFLGRTTLAVALTLATAATPWADPVTAATRPPPSLAVVRSAYGHMPLSFEANQGQVDSSVQFLSRGQGHTLFLTPSDAVLTLRTGDLNG